MASHSNPLKTDVAIIGAGPAGATTAISCAQAGLDVIILDRERFTRERPGETLHPGIEVLLEELRVAERVSQAGFPRHEGIWVRWDTPPRFVTYGADAAGQWRGYQAWGADLDTILLTRALELGAHVLRPCRALDPIVFGGRVSGLESSLGTIEAKVVVDASGSSRWLARRLGLMSRQYSPRLIARFGYREGACADRDEVPTITADETGWTWIAKIRPNLYHWTRLNLNEDTPDANYVPTELRGLLPLGRSRGADVSWRIVTKPAGPGYYVVGDAAAILDPASSHGVLKAVLSGTLAARLIVEAIALGNGVAAAQRYEGWVNDRFEHDVAGLRALYARLPRPPHWVRGGRTEVGFAPASHRSTAS